MGKHCASLEVKHRAYRDAEGGNRRQSQGCGVGSAQPVPATAQFASVAGAPLGRRRTRRTAPDVLENGFMKRKKVRCYQYVNRPYADVKGRLSGDPVRLLAQATTSAAARASSVASSLHVNMGGVELGVDVRVYVVRAREEESVAGLSPVYRVEIAWEAARNSSLFPVMHAEISAWPLSSTETQLEVEGDYEPPLGVVGSAIDAAVGHRIAEATVHRFLDDIVEQLRRELPGASP